MTITERVVYDVECMRAYFSQLFAFSESSAKSFVPEPSSGKQFLPFGISHFIRPDMVCNIYSLVDFWLAELCAYHCQRGKLSIDLNKFKKSEMGKKQVSDLHVYGKYLSEIASLDMHVCQGSFDQLNDLRLVRNVVIHGGGHVCDKNRVAISNIREISVQATLVVISEYFISRSLDHASLYLQAVANGLTEA